MTKHQWAFFFFFLHTEKPWDIIVIPVWECRNLELSLKVKMKVTQSCLTLCDPTDYTVHRILQARILEWARSPSPGDLPNPGIEPRFTALRVDSLPAETWGKLKNTGVGSPFLLQRIFPTQELKRGLRILYQLS